MSLLEIQKLYGSGWTSIVRSQLKDLMFFPLLKKIYDLFCLNWCHSSVYNCNPALHCHWLTVLILLCCGVVISFVAYKYTYMWLFVVIFQLDVSDLSLCHSRTLWLSDDNDIEESEIYPTPTCIVLSFSCYQLFIYFVCFKKWNVLSIGAFVMCCTVLSTVLCYSFVSDLMMYVALAYEQFWCMTAGWGFLSFCICFHTLSQFVKPSLGLFLLFLIVYLSVRVELIAWNASWCGNIVHSGFCVEWQSLRSEAMKICINFVMQSRIVLMVCWCQATELLKKMETAFMLFYFYI